MRRTLDEYEKLVKTLEAGKLPPGEQDRDSAVKSLLDQLYAENFATPAERYKAQHLAMRLERMKSS